MTAALLDIWKTVGVSGVMDITLMSILIYTLIIWFKRSRAVFVLIGIFIIGLIYLAAREFNLQLLAAVFQGFFAVILIAVIVIFQEEIKHLFERLAVWSLNRRITRTRVIRLSRQEVDVLVRTVTDFSRERTGALIVLRGKDAIVRHINGGVDLNGELSEPLLKSIFNRASMGHDGAVIIEQNRVTQFSSHLPLSKDLRKLPRGSGTRHAAALGLAELTDALCLVVSEERGTISVARNGEFEAVSDPERLSVLLQRFYDEMNPTETKGPLRARLTKNWREKTISVAITIALWFFFVHEGRLTYKAMKVPVDYTNVPAGLIVEELRPPEIEVTLSGPRRDFYFIRPKRTKLVLNLIDGKVGFQTKYIQKSNISIPPKLTIENVQPNKVRVVLREASDASK